MVIQNDNEGRDLEATLQGDGFTWELWVDLETRDAVIRKRFPTVSHIVHQWKVSSVQDDFEELLKNYVEQQTK
jgi:hypothetical protein